MQDPAQQQPNKGDDASNNDDGRGKRAIALFPRLPLSKIIELPRAIYELGEGEPIRRLHIFDRLGRQSESGPSRALVSVAGGGYGLTTGGYKADRLGLTDRGLRIVNPSNDREKYEAIYEALFSNEVFSRFMARFSGRSVPDEKIALDHLRQASNLSEADAKAALAVFMQNIEDYGLIHELSGRRVIVSREVALEQIGRGTSTQEARVDSEESAPPRASHTTDERRASDQGVAKERPVPAIHFNIQVHLPADASPDVYDAIFKSMATYLLGYDEDAR